MPNLMQTVRVGHHCQKTVADLQSRIGVKFCNGVDIVGGDIPVNFLTDPRPFASKSTYRTSRKNLAFRSEKGGRGPGNEL
jgi:hypothetical protein